MIVDKDKLILLNYLGNRREGVVNGAVPVQDVRQDDVAGAGEQ